MNFILKHFVTIQDDRSFDYATLYCEQYCEGVVKQLQQNNLVWDEKTNIFC